MVSELLEVIDEALGLEEFGLPEHLERKYWMKPVKVRTIPTFSRYFPHAIDYVLTPDKLYDAETWLIDEKLCESIHIIGCGDINWHTFSMNSSAAFNGGGIYTPLDVLTDNFDVEDVMMQQMYADLASIFKNSMYPEFKEPNMIKMRGIVSANKFVIKQNIPIVLFVRHAENLMTIPDTKLETFNNLAIADVAGWLYNKLKRIPLGGTPYGEIELHLDDLKDAWLTRNDIIQEMKEAYVSPANRYQPLVVAI